MPETYWLERAWLGAADPGPAGAHVTGSGGSGDTVDGVLVAVEEGRFVRVETGVAAPPGAHRLAGLTVPGLANCHSHAFHRALRGRTQRERGTFWSWREQMYALADRLDPDRYYDLARATYREMLAAGFTSVGEFHYLHHGRGGRPYDEPNAMGVALVEAARDVGIRIALLDACYLGSGIGTPADGVQQRFSDGDAEGWASRLERLEHAGGEEVVVGAAIHSVRAVPRDQIHLVADWADAHRAPLHAHLSEQVAENVACLAAYGETPTGVLEEAGALGPRSTVVHATHLTDADVALLGDSRSHVCFCATTERDLADGIGPSRLLHEAGALLTIGSDSHAVVDPFEEMRAVELDERLASQERGHWSAAELLTAASAAGHRSLGFPDAGRIAVGAPADLVTLDLLSPRTAGTGGSAETAVFAAGAADVVHVVAQGRVVLEPGQQRDVGAALDRAVRAVWED
ncbi:formimidoylglutamate deiminase [Nocardioides mesophilus]|uniref:Formimidoylglutamate deiminase n=1 Tax=Nocardioides mesophilus TaxID=433659 RepID=A0A7G9RF48_9ACTN|nr:formimidoylglutamate deiminase [Nocardioides mesophilus]QNN54223.1 formimidoylglutamate deiminase [Nocardioides mesophilus]